MEHSLVTFTSLGMPKINVSQFQKKISQNKTKNFWLIIITYFTIQHLYSFRTFMKVVDPFNASLTMICLVGSAAGLSFLWLNTNHVMETATYINEMLKLENSLSPENKKYRIGDSNKMRNTTAAKLFCKMIVMATWLFPMVLGFTTAMIPCSPPNFFAPFSKFLGLCKGSSESGGHFIQVAQFLVFGTLHCLMWLEVCIVGLCAGLHVFIGFTSQRYIKPIFKHKRYRKIQLTLFILQKYFAISGAS